MDRRRPLELESTHSPVDKEFVIRCRRKVRLGPIGVEIRSNEERFSGMSYFPSNARLEEGARTDYTLSFCNLNVDSPWPMPTITARQDRSYRAGRFASGYYITDHFGAPAYLLTEGTHYWIFATDFAAILWPYVVKLLLTLYAIEHGMLHLKAAGIAVDGAGTLFVGRGGSGKTVLLTRLCQTGAQFLSNTHTLIDGSTLLAVPAAMRVRNDSLFGPIIAERHLPFGIKRGEYVADPGTDLGWEARFQAPVRNVCLIDYRGPDKCEIREFDRDILGDYMEQFSLALNVYGLKDDVLDYLQNDVARFSAQAQVTKEKLRTLLARCNTYYISCDANDPRNLQAVRELLAGRPITTPPDSDHSSPPRDA